jgi:hypothetical protein
MSSKVIDLVQTNPKPGQEKEFEEWYQKHMYDLLRVPGILSVQRYYVTSNRREEGEGYDGMPQPYRHLALYEIEGDPADVLAGIERARNAGNIPWSDALDPIFSAYFYEPVGEKVVKPAE